MHTAGLTRLATLTCPRRQSWSATWRSRLTWRVSAAWPSYTRPSLTTCLTHAGFLREVGVKGLVKGSHTDLSPLLPGAVRLVFSSKGQAEKALSALDSVRRGCLTTRAAYDKSHHRLHSSAGKQCRRQVSIEQEELRLNPTPVPKVTRQAPPQAPPYVAPPKELRGHAMPPLDDVLEAGLGVDMGYRTRSVAARPEPGAAEVEAAEAAAAADAAAAAEAAMTDKSPGATPKTVPKPAPLNRAALGSHTPYRHLNEEEQKEHRALRAEALRAAHAGLTRWVQAVKKARLAAAEAVEQSAADRAAAEAVESASEILTLIAKSSLLLAEAGLECVPPPALPPTLNLSLSLSQTLTLTLALTSLRVPVAGTGRWRTRAPLWRARSASRACWPSI